MFESPQQPLLVGALLGEKVLGENSGGLNVLRVIHENKGLEGSVGHSAFSDTGFSVGCIKSCHSRRRQGSLPVSINRTPIEVFPMVLNVGLRGSRS